MNQTTILASTKEHIQMAATAILQGEVVAMPTETVYGLAANALNAEAVAKIFQIKGRPQDNPLIVHIANVEMLSMVTGQLPPLAETLASAFWPGPLTMVLKKETHMPDCVSAGLDTVGVRMPSHPVALDLILSCGVPLAAPSANLSTKPSPTTTQHVKQDFEGKISIILEGGACEVGIESTVIRFVGNSAEQIEILRPGSITKEQLLTFAPVRMHKASADQMSGGEKVASPGMKYRHYAPKATMTLVQGGILDFLHLVTTKQTEHTGVLVFEGEQTLFNSPSYVYGDKKDSASQAKLLFDALRKIDQTQMLEQIFVRAPNKQDVGMAVYNRLLRGCEFREIDATATIVVGVTGQTGAGKSDLCQHIAARENAAIIDGDAIAHVVLRHPDKIRKIQEKFGVHIVDSSGQINRKALGQIVFTKSQNRVLLEQMMADTIKWQIRQEMLRFRQKKVAMILLDAPLLIEYGLAGWCDKILGVCSDWTERMARIVQRDLLSSEAALARISAGQEESFYRAKTDMVLNNDGDLVALFAQAEQTLAMWRN